MLQSYYPIYQLALELETLQTKAEICKRSVPPTAHSYGNRKAEISASDAGAFKDLLVEVHKKCSA